MAADFESKLMRGISCAQAMEQLRAEGFVPDLVVAHPGWGEALFCKDVWPQARLLVFSEFFYSAVGADYGFDPEFDQGGLAQRMNLRLKNTALLHALQACDLAYAPTQWQHSRVPREYRSKVEVIFDGIDTERLRPDPDATFMLPAGRGELRAGEEVLTFVNRNLEPYRGFHTFMRALPQILQERRQAQCVLVGGDDVSYGRKPRSGGSWREVLMREVGDGLPLDRVHFVGKLAYADYLRLLQVSRCHAYLTYPFVLSWSCVEAMSVGCTIVASRTAPVAEVIEDGETGLLTDFFDADALARKVVDVLAEPHRFSHLGRQARRKAITAYDLQSVCLPAQIELVKRALAMPPPDAGLDHHEPRC